MAQTNRVAVRLDIEGAEQVKAALISLGVDGEAALKRLNFEGAANENKILSATMEEATGIAREYAGELGPIGAILSSLGGGWLVAGAAAAGFAYVLEQSTEKAEAYKQAMRGVSAVLKATDDSSGVTAEQISAMAEEIAGSTLQTREAVIGAAEELATFGVAGPKAFKATLEAAADLAASPVFHGDLAAAAKALGQSMEGNYTSLRRAGIVLTETQKDLIKSFEDTGDKAGALGAVIAIVEGKLGGAAQAQDQGLTGATHRASEAWDHLLTTLGQSQHAGGVAEALLTGLTERLERIDRVGQSKGFLAVLGFMANGALNLALGTNFETLGQADAAHPAATAVPKIGAPSSPATVTTSGIYDTTPEGRAAIQRERDRELLDSVANAHRFNVGLGEQADELAKPKLSQAIDKAIADAAKAAKTSPQNYATNPAFAAEYKSTVGNATTEYNNQNAEKFANQAAEAARKAEEAARKANTAFKEWLTSEDERFKKLIADGADQIKLTDDLTKKNDAAYSAMRSAQDTYLVDATKGSADYYAAVAKQSDDQVADQLKAINDEESAAKNALDKKAAQYALDGAAFASYQNDLTQIQEAAQEKRDAVAAQAQQRQLAQWREYNGALQQFTDEATKDWNQSLKQVAADGLNDIENGILTVTRGTQSLGTFMKQLPLDIVGSLEKQALEKEVIGPLGDAISGLFGGGSAAKPDGSSSNPYHVILAGVLPLSGTGEFGTGLGTPGFQHGPDPLLASFAPETYGTGLGTAGFEHGSDPILLSLDEGAQDVGQGITTAFESGGGGFLSDLEKVLTSALSGSSGGGGGGIFGFLGDLFGGGAYSSGIGPSGALNGAGDLSGLTASIPEIPGFAGGGEFRVPGHGPTDSVPINFMATPGETVSIRTPSQRLHADPEGARAAGHVINAPVTVHLHLDGAVDAKTMMQYADAAGRHGGEIAVQTIKSNLPTLMSESQARFG